MPGNTDPVLSSPAETPKVFLCPERPLAGWEGGTGGLLASLQPRSGIPARSASPYPHLQWRVGTLWASGDLQVPEGHRQGEGSLPASTSLTSQQLPLPQGRLPASTGPEAETSPSIFYPEGLTFLGSSDGPSLALFKGSWPDQQQQQERRRPLDLKAGTLERKQPPSPSPAGGPSTRSCRTCLGLPPRALLGPPGWEPWKGRQRKGRDTNYAGRCLASLPVQTVPGKTKY